MLRDTRSYETQIIDAVRSVNRALGGTYGTSSAIHKSDFNQYEVQLIDAIKGIGRTLSGKGLSVVGGGIADTSGFAAQLQDLSRRVTTLENESFFRLVDGNVTLKSQYRNLWVPGWLAAGGVGTGGGGGGSVEHLSDIGDVSISNLTDGQGIVWDATNNVWKNATVGGGGGYVLPTASASTLGGIKVGSGLSINASGVLSVTGGGSVTGYIGTTQVQSSSQAQALTGILSVKNSTNNSLFEWDGDNNAWHFYGNLYADGWVAAGGVGSGSSGGSVVTISNLLSSGTRIATITVNGTGYDILAPQGGSGTVTRIDLGSTQYSPVNGVVSLPAYPSTLDQIADGATRKLSDYLPLTGGTMTGNIVMSGASIVPSANNTCGLGTSSARFAGIYGVDADLSGDLSLASTSEITLGPVTISYDSTNYALHISGTDSGHTIGIYCDGFVAAGGVGQTS